MINSASFMIAVHLPISNKMYAPMYAEVWGNLIGTSHGLKRLHLEIIKEVYKIESLLL